VTSVGRHLPHPAIPDDASGQQKKARRRIERLHSTMNDQTTLDKDRNRSIAGRFCVLVSSSDHGRDVFEIVFQKAETIWRDCDWPRFVGFTKKHPDLYGFKALAAKIPSDWRGELSDQLDGLPDEIEYVLLTFEDALFTSPVNGSELDAIANLIVQDDLPYVSLFPLRRNLPGLVIEFFRRKLSRCPLRRLSFSEPYYSSIATAIWKRSYLQRLLRQTESIWDFEHIVTDEPHFAVWKPVLMQDQLVTKGKWSSRAPRMLAQQGIVLSESRRGFRRLSSRLRDIREFVVFQTIGFLSFRIRRRLNRISHRAPPQDIYKSSFENPIKKS